MGAVSTLAVFCCCCCCCEDGGGRSDCVCIGGGIAGRYFRVRIYFCLQEQHITLSNVPTLVSELNFKALKNMNITITVLCQVKPKSLKDMYKATRRHIPEDRNSMT